MTYTVWSAGEQIGETDFEMTRRGRKRMGVFRPTPHGLTLLPSITAVFPALMAFKALCAQRGYDADRSPDDAAAALEVLANTPEGRRVVAAARQISLLELRDARGGTLAWDSIAISDMEELRRLALEGTREPESDAMPDVPPIRYMISATLARGVSESAPRRTEARRGFGALPA